MELDLPACPPVSINRQELQQVMISLLINAAKRHARDGGTLTLYAPALVAHHPGATKPAASHPAAPRGTVIEVLDTGSGLSKEKRWAGCFKPFSTTRPDGKRPGPVDQPESGRALRRRNGCPQPHRWAGCGVQRAAAQRSSGQHVKTLSLHAQPRARVSPASAA